MADEIKQQQSPPAPPPSQPKAGASGLAITSLILGIVGLLCCGLLPASIAAWITGHIERKNIKAGRSSQAGQGISTAGWILGIIGTVLWSLIALVYTVIVVITIFMSSAGNSM